MFFNKATKAAEHMHRNASWQGCTSDKPFWSHASGESGQKMNLLFIDLCHRLVQIASSTLQSIQNSWLLHLSSWGWFNKKGQNKSLPKQNSKKPSIPLFIINTAQAKENVFSMNCKKKSEDEKYSWSSLVICRKRGWFCFRTNHNPFV